MSISMVTVAKLTFSCESCEAVFVYSLKLSLKLRVPAAAGTTFVVAKGPPSS